MSPNLTTISEGKKFMWDGRTYDTREEALCQAAAYEKDNFEVRMVEAEGKFHAYTRRVVKEVVVAAS